MLLWDTAAVWLCWDINLISLPWSCLSQSQTQNRPLTKQDLNESEEKSGFHERKSVIHFLKFWGVDSKLRSNTKIIPRKTNGFRTEETAGLLHTKRGNKDTINMSRSRRLSLNESVSQQTFLQMHRKSSESGAQPVALALVCFCYQVKKSPLKKHIKINLSGCSTAVHNSKRPTITAAVLPFLIWVALQWSLKSPILLGGRPLR